MSAKLLSTRFGCRSKFIRYVGDFYITKREYDETHVHAYTYTYKYIHIKGRSYEVRKRTRAKSLGLKEKW